MTTPDTLQTALQNLNIRSTGSSVLNKRDLTLALEAFSDIHGDRRNVGLAYAYLASVLLGTGNTAKPDLSNTRNEARRYIRSLLDFWISETGFSELSKAFAALTAVLELDKATFDEYLQEDAMQERILEAGDIVCADYKIVESAEHGRAKLCLAAFISQAAGQAAPLAKKLANPDGSRWLYNRLMDTHEDLTVRAAAAVAFIKFQSITAPRTIATATATEAGSQDSAMPLPATSILLQIYKEAISVDEEVSSYRSVQLGLEGLGVATLKPSTRKSISADIGLLQLLLKLAALPSRHFSTAVVFGNLLTYPREQGAHDRMKASIRRYASQGDNEEEEQESRADVDKRALVLLEAGIMQAVIAYSKSSSVAVNRLCGQIVLGLVENTKNRGVVIQQGGPKALLEVILKSSIYKTPSAPNKEDYIAVQAFAKLLITANPLLVLGPTPQSQLLIAAVKPLTSPIIYDGSTSLQRFESLMALTNIASLSEELQERMSSTPSLLDKVETIIIDSDSSLGDTMCRRAAVELLCNLASSETTFVRYTAIDVEAEMKDGRLPSSVASRINVLLALSDSEDRATREAALGVLATFTLAPTVACYIGATDSRSSKILNYLSDVEDEPGMQLRAVECLKNIAQSCSSRREQIMQAMQAATANTAGFNIFGALEDALKQLSA